jgi:YVTN family beta-propeller protein
MMSFRRIIIAATLLTAPVIATAAQLLVLNKADATLAFIDPRSGETTATVATGAGPHEVELSSDGKLAFVSNYGASEDGTTISVIDVVARKELRRIELGDLKRPHGLTFSNGHLYFTSERSRKVGRLDAAAKRVEWTFPTNEEKTHMVLAAPDGKALYTANIDSGTVSILERGANDRWTQTLVKVGAGPEGLDLSPDGRELWVGQSRDGGIAIIDTATKRLAYSIDAKTKRSNRVKFTPDGRWVLVSDLGAGELVVFDARTRTEQQRLRVGRGATGVLIPKGERYAYVALSGENRLALVDLKTLAVAKSISTGGSPDGMAWLP